MNFLKTILLILLFPFFLAAAFGVMIIDAIARFIEDVYDDDMYWGGKD